jgi:hypothetical protein
LPAAAAAAAAAASGAHDMSQLKAHPLFEGVDWQAVRGRPAPVPAPLPQPSPDDVGLDWELTSLLQQQPVRYEYLPSGTPV